MSACKIVQKSAQDYEKKGLESGGEGDVASELVPKWELLGVQPLVFVSKAEVRRWPVLGWLTACAGTLFLKREAKADILRVSESFASLIEAGVVVTIFPEGTSTDSRQVLPFRPSLLEPAAANGWRVSPAWIAYRLEDGSVGEEVCYWGDMTFAPHLLNLLSKKEIRAFVAYGEPVARGMDRKALALTLHGNVCALAQRHRHHVRPARSGVARAE